MRENEGRDITGRDRRWYDLAEKTAKLSDCRYKLGAVIVRGGSVLSVACNVLRSHTSHANWLPWVVSIHAEHRAIILAGCSLEHATLYVARWKGDSSKPCCSCYAVIVETGIRDICYLNKNELHKARVA